MKNRLVSDGTGRLFLAKSTNILVYKFSWEGGILQKGVSDKNGQEFIVSQKCLVTYHVPDI